MVRLYKNYQRFFLITMSIIFVGLGLRVRTSNEGILFDNIVLEYLHNNINPLFLRIMRFISFIGSAYFIIPVMTLVVAYNHIKNKSYESKLLLISTAGSWIFNYLLKQIFQRTRPLEYFLVEQGGYSYPSGHTMMATTFYFTVAYILTRKTKDKKKKTSFYIMATIAILVMGFSRVYLGVHWPTDIIGGFTMGYIFYNLSVTFTEYYRGT